MNDATLPTTRSIDERVARVEENVKNVQQQQTALATDVAALKADMAVVRSEQTHVSALITSSANENRAANALLVTKIDSLAVNAAHREGVDLKSDQDFQKLSTMVGQHQSMLDKMVGMTTLIKFAIGGSVIGLLVGIVSLFQLLFHH